MTNLATKLFGPPQEINVWQRGLTHLSRWTIFKTSRFKVYLEHSFGDNWNGEPHHYPRQFVSIGIAGTDNHHRARASSERDAWMLSIGRGPA